MMPGRVEDHVPRQHATRLGRRAIGRGGWHRLGRARSRLGTGWTPRTHCSACIPSYDGPSTPCSGLASTLGERVRELGRCVFAHVVPQYQNEAHPEHLLRLTASDCIRWHPSQRLPFSPGKRHVVSGGIRAMTVPAGIGDWAKAAFRPMGWIPSRMFWDWGKFSAIEGEVRATERTRVDL